MTKKLQKNDWEELVALDYKPIDFDESKNYVMIILAIILVIMEESKGILIHIIIKMEKEKISSL